MFCIVSRLKHGIIRGENKGKFVTLLECMLSKAFVLRRAVHVIVFTNI